MATPTCIKSSQGTWKGSSKLYLPWLPEEEQIRSSESELTIRCSHGDAYAQIHYTWHEDDAPQEGLITVAKPTEGASITAGWADSWHQSSDVMKLIGLVLEDGTVDLRGAYQVPGHPDWGWRITLAANGPGNFNLKMYNVTPYGEEEWAVDANYTRVD